MVASQDNPEDVQRLSEGFYYSILSMLAVPACLFAVLLVVILRTNRARAEVATGESGLGQ